MRCLPQQLTTMRYEEETRPSPEFLMKLGVIERSQPGFAKTGCQYDEGSMMTISPKLTEIRERLDLDFVRRRRWRKHLDFHLALGRRQR